MPGVFSTLGLDEIEADPNFLPDGKWAGEVVREDYVFVKSKNEVSHVLTYRVTEGVEPDSPWLGRERTEWFTLGTGPEYDDKGSIIGITTATMTQKQRPWYKKRLLDLGIPESEQTDDYRPGPLVGRKITFGTKKNGAYVNINFVELRGDDAVNFKTTPAADNAPAGAVNVNPDGSTEEASPAKASLI